MTATWKNKLFYGDNLDVLRESVGTESVDLTYLDPPFNSNRSYNVLFKEKSGDEAQAQIEAFDDTWTWSQDALEAMRRLLGDNNYLSDAVSDLARPTPAVTSAPTVVPIRRSG